MKSIDATPAAPDSLRLMTYNIQGGLRTNHYRHYVTGAWRHALPHKGRSANLVEVADVMRGCDLVAVQEGDAGSFRTHRQNQLGVIATRAGFVHHGVAVTRDFGAWAQICIGYLSRQAPLRQVVHRLPTRIPGRGALELDFELAGEIITVMIAHLSLPPQTRRRQLRYLAEQLKGRKRIILTGDLNSSAAFLRRQDCLRVLGLQLPAISPKTFPSWGPTRDLDHILIGAGLELRSIEALQVPFSDHLPLVAEIGLRP